MNMFDFLWNNCAQDLDRLYDYIESTEVKNALKFYPQILRQLKFLLSNTVKAIYTLEGFAQRKKSDAEDERDTKVLQFQQWQKQAAVCGV